jgi:beta-aspartyl-peptidase (threonine type)
MSTIIVHGSVETSEAYPFIKALQEAVQKGYKALSDGCLPSVVSTVNELEDNPLFNAGRGSVLNLEGNVEVDGSVMDGESGRFAGVAAVPNIRYAITAAYKLLQHSKHVLLAGEGAAKFAKENGIESDDCITPDQLESWRTARRLLDEGKELNFSPYTGLKPETDTVGCVVVNDAGKLAAGSSTGGSFMKYPGRVGDTPIIGGGIFASKYSAIVCTGRGEAFIQTLTAKFVDDQIQAGTHPQEAAIMAIERMTSQTGETGGLIVVDSWQRFGAVHNCSSFPVVVMINGVIQNVKPIQIGEGTPV